MSIILCWFYFENVHFFSYQDREGEINKELKKIRLDLILEFPKK